MIMFRPVEGEVLVGKVHSSNKNGIRVSLEFMDDVWIPSYNCAISLLRSRVVQEGSAYDPIRRMWIWHYNDGDQQLDFNVETGEFIRFRVVALQYNRLESGESGEGIKIENNTLVTSEVKKAERETDRSVRTAQI